MIRGSGLGRASAGAASAANGFTIRAMEELPAPLV